MTDDKMIAKIAAVTGAATGFQCSVPYFDGQFFNYCPDTGFDSVSWGSGHVNDDGSVVIDD
jgi:hypothetical protein